MRLGLRGGPVGVGRAVVGVEGGRNEEAQERRRDARRGTRDARLSSVMTMMHGGLGKGDVHTAYTYTCPRRRPGTRALVLPIEPRAKL